MVLLSVMPRPSSRPDRSGPSAQDSPVVLSVRVTPRAGANALAGWADGFLRVRLAAPPVEGRANEALVRFLAGCAGLAPSRVQLLSGDRGRDKRVRFEGIDPATLRTRLGIPLEGHGA